MIRAFFRGFLRALTCRHDWRQELWAGVDRAGHASLVHVTTCSRCGARLPE